MSKTIGYKRVSSTDQSTARQLDGVQVDMGNAANKMHLRQASVQAAYLEAAKRTGLEIASLAMAELNNVPLKSDPQAAGWLEDSIDVMHELNVNVVLIA